MVKFDTSHKPEPSEEPLLGPAYADMVECEKLLEQNDTQFARRSFCRSAFAYIETLVSWMKTIAVEIVADAGMSSGELEVTLISALLDDKPRVDRTGVIKLEPNRLPFLNEVALVVRSIAEKGGRDPAAPFKYSNWDHLQKALSVRHRITHPKSLDDMNLTETDMEHIRAGLTWIIGCIVGVANFRVDSTKEQKNGSALES